MNRMFDPLFTNHHAHAGDGRRPRVKPTLRCAALALALLLASCPALLAQYPPTKPGSPLLDPKRNAEQPVEVRLLSDVSAIRPESRFHIIVHFDIAPDWSIGWRNAGDLPLGATKVKLEAPPNFTVSEATWSGPHGRVTPAGLAEYVYFDAAAVAYEIAAPKQLEGVEEAAFIARCEWTATSRAALPGRAEVTLALPVVDADADVEASESQTEVLNILAGLPTEPKELGLDLQLTWDRRDLLLSAPGADLLSFFPFESKAWEIDNSAACVEHPGSDLRLEVRELKRGPREPLSGILALGKKTGRRVQWTYLQVTAPPQTIDE